MSYQSWLRFESIAKASPDRPAIIEGDAALSFGQLRGVALAWAAILNVGPGDRVVLSGRNSLALAAAVPAIWKSGAIPVLVHAEAPAHHLAHICDLTGPACILRDKGAVAIPDIANRVIEIALPDTGPDKAQTHISALKAAGQDPDTPASIVFTSGSTGLPKGVVQPARNLIGGADRVAAHLGYRETDRILCPIPFAFDYGWGQLLSTLLRGLTMILPSPQNAFGSCAAIGRHQPTILAGVSAFFADLLGGLSPIRTTPRDTIRLITNTGSKIPAPLFESLSETFPDADISLNYGLTETYRSTSLPVSEAHTYPDSVGYPLPGVKIEVLRPDGTRADVGEEGEIVHRGEGAFMGYYRDPERTGAVLRPDPFDPAAAKAVFTGDLGRIDGAGRLYIHGRRDRQMKSMGVRVAPDEIEALLLESGLIEAAAVTSRPNDTLGDMIVAFVVVKPGSDPDAELKSLKKHARTCMSPYMLPRLWHVVESLPRTPNAKVDYPQLARIARGELVDG